MLIISRRSANANLMSVPIHSMWTPSLTNGWCAARVSMTSPLTSSPANVPVRTDRDRGQPNKCARNGRLLDAYWTLTGRLPKFPVGVQKLPVPQNIFPVSLNRELFDKSLQDRGLLPRIVSQTPGITNFPVKFPVSREFAWRRVRSALRRQPGSLTT